MDEATRDRLRPRVAEARESLEADFREQLEARYGIRSDGQIVPLDRLTNLSYAGRTRRQAILDTVTHEQAAGSQRDSIARYVREAAFTALNRLAALKLMEADNRRLIRPSVGAYRDSAGFKEFVQISPELCLSLPDGGYQLYLELLFDDLSNELGVLFDRELPPSLLFPSEICLRAVLDILNQPDLADIWAEDETIGWIYQFFTPKQMRDQARKESAAPRNSYELAFRNQFFTPRYVVEFLVDNTLGRLWWEMRQGQTSLASVCQTMLIKPHPIWLRLGRLEPAPFQPSGSWGAHEGGGRMWTRPNPALHDAQLSDSAPRERVWEAIQQYALTVDGYAYAWKLKGVIVSGEATGTEAAAELANSRLEEYKQTGTWRGTFEELRVCLFFEQRRSHWLDTYPDDDDMPALLALHRAICEAWEREAELVPYRKKRDPRELRILDPACGSGHFLLYCFDLLIRIYQEAWEDEDLGPALHREFNGSFPTYQADVPGLILRHNLHGVDIDLRAIQIAGLALWLRAQREYADLSLQPDARLPIRRANLVYAEPMPGEYALLSEFARTLDPPALEPFVRDVWQE